GVEESLAALIRRPTVSWHDYGRADRAAFDGLAADLVGLFPLVHKRLDRKEIGDWGLLYECRGSDPSLAPAILCAHYDVVPADEPEEWAHAPFSGDIAELFVWGRGSQDVKCSLVCIMDAAERLLAQGFAPRRSVYFAFGADEEVGGPRGAAAIAGWLSAQGLRASFLLDEGGPVADGLFPLADRPLALIGIAEKGYIDVALIASGRGGHASMPPRRTATGDLARAIAAVEASPPPARLGYTLRQFLERLSPYVPFAQRLVFRNLWLLRGLVKAVFGASPATNALIRSTAAPTMLEASPKENVLADRARGTLNVRIIPGESSAQVLERLEGLVRRTGVEVRPAHEGLTVESLPESPVDHEGYRRIEAALAAAFPEAAPVPFLFSASTDTKHYRDVAEAIYRLTPLRQTTADLAGVHGRDERVSVANLRRCAIFYRALLASL
ncbi:MAG TPA: M20/M25/M40 family metallo-hydrolase, partial [Rectinemataceae bacterium]|nr:M20/M25/M40 family metallo-hydrolase [Rectinemataceae bacterium]